MSRQEQRFRRQHEGQRRAHIRMSDIRRLVDGVTPHVERRAAALASLRAWLETYAAHRCSLAWAPAHLELIRTLEQAVETRSENVCVVLPRGSGKTTIVLHACLWAVLSGRVHYCILITSESRRAQQLLQDLRRELVYHQPLKEDFPFIATVLESAGSRALRDVYYGESRVHIRATASMLVIPHCADTLQQHPHGQGSCIQITTLSGTIRGAQYTHPVLQRVLRPQMVVIDDPQKRKEAHSPPVVSEKYRTIVDDVLHLRGPADPMACVVVGTVIARDDLIERIQRDPRFRTVRYAAVSSLPAEGEQATLWRTYRELWLTEGPQAARAHYTEHRTQMDAGISVYWEQRKDPDDISAIEYFLRQWLLDPIGFWTELQNQPLTAAATDSHPDYIYVRPVPTSDAQVQQLAAGIDVGAHRSWYVVVGLTPGGYTALAWGHVDTDIATAVHHIVERIRSQFGSDIRIVVDRSWNTTLMIQLATQLKIYSAKGGSAVSAIHPLRLRKSGKAAKIEARYPVGYDDPPVHYVSDEGIWYDADRCKTRLSRVRLCYLAQPNAYDPTVLLDHCATEVGKRVYDEVHREHRYIWTTLAADHRNVIANHLLDALVLATIGLDIPTTTVSSSSASPSPSAQAGVVKPAPPVIRRAIVARLRPGEF